MWIVVSTLLGDVLMVFLKLMVVSLKRMVDVYSTVVLPLDEYG